MITVRTAFRNRITAFKKTLCSGTIQRCRWFVADPYSRRRIKRSGDPKPLALPNGKIITCLGKHCLKSLGQTLNKAKNTQTPANHDDTF
jgi:hypothetical protein